MSTPVRFTMADLEAFPDRLDDTRYELSAGELAVARSLSEMNGRQGRLAVAGGWTGVIGHSRGAHPGAYC